MKKKTLLFISICVVSFLTACRTSPDLTEDELYGIINEIIADDSLFVDRVCWKFQDIEITPELADEFTAKDLRFIRRQQDLYSNSIIKRKKLKYVRRRGEKPVNTVIDTVCNQGILYHVSFPLISADRQKVIIEFQEDCNCSLGGQGGKDLYEKKNGHWVRTKGFDHWISDNKKWQDETALGNLPPIL